MWAWCGRQSEGFPLCRAGDITITITVLGPEVRDAVGIQPSAAGRTVTAPPSLSKAPRAGARSLVGLSSSRQLPVPRRSHLGLWILFAGPDAGDPQPVPGVTAAPCALHTLRPTPGRGPGHSGPSRVQPDLSPQAGCVGTVLGCKHTRSVAGVLAHPAGPAVGREHVRAHPDAWCFL